MLGVVSQNIWRVPHWPRLACCINPWHSAVIKSLEAVNPVDLFVFLLDLVVQHVDKLGNTKINILEQSFVKHWIWGVLMCPISFACPSCFCKPNKESNINYECADPNVLNRWFACAVYHVTDLATCFWIIVWKQQKQKTNQKKKHPATLGHLCVKQKILFISHNTSWCVTNV